MITNTFAIALVSIIVGIFIGICICVIAFMIHVDLHYTDSEYEQLCDECKLHSRKENDQ